MSKETIALLFGVLSALPILAGLGQIPKEMFNALPGRVKRIVPFLVILGIFSGCAAQAMQYKQARDSDTGKRDAERGKRDAERKFARLLFLFNTDKRDLSAEYLRDDPYVAGYQAMHDALKHNTDFTVAEVHLGTAIKRGQFAPESHYLLAYISLVKYERGHEDSNLANAMKEATEAAKADPEYMAPYYLRSIVEFNSGMVDQGKKDLEIAVTGDGIQCANLQHADEIERWWKKVAQELWFKKMQMGCKARWGLPA